MWVTDFITPVSSSDGDHVHLGVHDGTLDSSLDFLSSLDTEAEMTIRVTDQDEGLESGSLTGGGLLLDGHNLHDFFLELVAEELVNNLGF